jgi:UDP-N-acetyl-D-galactosamine dehydrogenase
VPDIRNSKVEDIVREFAEFGISPIVHDPLADPAAAQHEFGITLSDLSAMHDLDALVLAVSHDAYAGLSRDALGAMLKPGGVVIDVKSVLAPAAVPEGARYWSL